MKMSFYEMLDVPRKAPQAQIDRAYAMLTAKLGATTSVRGSAETLTQLNMIKDGYRILSDPEKRAMYDAKLYASDAGIKLMFFPKDTKAVKKLGIDTMIFALLACVFTYVIYQKLVREPEALRVEQSKAAEMPKGDMAKTEARVNAPAPVNAAVNPSDPKAIGTPGEK